MVQHFKEELQEMGDLVEVELLELLEQIIVEEMVQMDLAVAVVDPHIKIT